MFRIFRKRKPKDKKIWVPNGPRILWISKGNLTPKQEESIKEMFNNCVIHHMKPIENITSIFEPFYDDESKNNMQPIVEQIKRYDYIFGTFSKDIIRQLEKYKSPKRIFTPRIYRHDGKPLFENWVQLNNYNY